MPYKTKTHILENISVPSILKPAGPAPHVAGTKGVLHASIGTCISRLVGGIYRDLLILIYVLKKTMCILAAASTTNMPEQSKMVR